MSEITKPIILDETGQAGVQALLEIVKILTGSSVTIKGADGKDGQDGADGFSPTVSIAAITGGQRITITDANGAKTIDVLNGTNGQNGKDGTSVTHSWNGTTLTVVSASGTSSADLKGDTGQRGTGLLAITTAPSAYTTAVNGLTPAYRIALSTVKTQASTDDVFAGDTLRYSYYHYPVIYVDSSYVYCRTRVNIRGAAGAAGADGYTPVKGVDYFDGQDGHDGYTPVKGVDYFDGEDGKKGEDGKDGLDATPVTPLFANSTDECTDTTKFYVLPDGFIYAYQYVEATGPSYTNVAGTITYDKRLSSSGKVSSSAMAGAAYTDFIPVKQGQIVRIKNFDINSSFSSSAYPYVCFYTAANENSAASSPAYIRPGDAAEEFDGVYNSVNGSVVTWTAFTINGNVQHSSAASITHIRISGKYFADKEVIVTIDEEITEGGGGGYQWVNTGHAFVPADYEAEILDLQKNKANKNEIPTELPNPNALTIDGVKYDGSKEVTIETQSGGNILYGKKWVACGDSFTANGYNASDGFDESVYIYQDGRFAGRYKVYPNIIGLRNNMNIVNLATGGQTMANSSNSFMTRYATIPADADYITIMLGINDKVQGISVGAIDSTDTATFCGAFNVAMEHIIENHPFAHIGIMVSHGTNEEIMEATRDIAERWGVPYLDYGSPQVPLMNRYTGRNVCAKAQEIRERNFCVISDGTTPTNAHPNTAAHEYESTFIEAWLRTL